MKKAILILSFLALPAILFAQKKQVKIIRHADVVNIGQAGEPRLSPVMQLGPDGVLKFSKTGDNTVVITDTVFIARLNAAEAVFIYKQLEEKKQFIQLSDDVSMRRGNLQLIPSIDSAMTIIGKQAQRFQEAEKKRKLEAESAKAKNDSVIDATNGGKIKYQIQPPLKPSIKE